jgi:NAD(P) transhydrogenase subunit alpha
VREQVESLGAKFVDLGLSSEAAEGAGGYARAMDEDFYRRQREALARVVAESDVVITTASVPGRRAPLLVTEGAVRSMRPGSVVVDLAAATGGNCENSRPGETVESAGVTILAPLDLPSSLAHPASQMYARNVAAFLENLVHEGKVRLDLDDPILRATLLTREGKIVHPAFEKPAESPVGS